MTRRKASQSAETRRGPARRNVALRILVFLLLLVSIQASGLSGVAAAPVAPGSQPSSRFQVPGWLSAEAASRLDLGFDVLVPSEVPSPFDGEPAVDAYDGFYSLYWMIPGSPPTYLLITGEVGGTIPDFSYYDRNVQLEVNAEVQGTPAYHDLTPIYDKVYWQVGNIVYIVDSHNLDAIDSLSLANSLFPLGGPPPSDTGGETGGDTGSGGNTDTGNEDGNGTVAADATLGVPESVESGDVVAVGVGGVTNATLTADAGAFSGSGEATLTGVEDGSYDWQAPETDADVTVTFTLSSGESGENLTTAQTVVQGATSSGEATNASISCPALATAGKQARLSVTGGGTLTVDASDGVFPAEPPNTDFAPDADGSDVLTGTLPDGGAVTLAWLAPEVEMPAYFFVYDPEGNTIAECGTQVTFEEVQTEEKATPTPKPKKKGKRGDGTELDGKLDTVVAEVLAYQKPAGTATGDATGAPKSTAVSTEFKASAKDAATPTPSPKPAKPTPTVVPTATLAPATGTDGMVAQVIGPEGGDLRCPSGTGAVLVVPPQALKEPSTVTIRPIADTKLPTHPDISLVPGTAFDLTIAAANGESVDKLGSPATLTITLPKAAAKPNLMIYRVTGTRLEAMSSASVNGTTISVPLNRFSRVVAGLPAPSAPTSTTRDPMPFILAALGFVVALMAIFAAGSHLLRQRPRTVSPRRAVPSRVRIR